ncbi:uncharacterized protein C14orf93 homolog [Hemiscyllium ocellatum]|uniref:uncharacterized protein C14orf93 homolog n=1 Tax=Hemiscyllium ocellatum TaxID=170820 RepID=UPI0029671043|nr:uncharacterized protein C14orf93 homolog [Hemiscyllium ocellatum]
MSFSATILFTPPAPGGEEQGPPAPVAVAGGGLAVRDTNQLLHLIYQRLQRAAETAEEALTVARSNQRALQRLELDVRSLAEGLRASQGGSPSTQQSPRDGEAPPAGSGVSWAPEPQENQPFRQAKCQVYVEGPSVQSLVCDTCTAACSPVHHLPSSPTCRPSSLCTDSRADSDLQPELYPEASQGSEDSSGPNLKIMEDIFHSGFTAVTATAPSYTVPARSRRLKSSRRKRDVVLSKMVHGVHNHVSNERRFNGSESIRSSWNIGVIRFLVEKLKVQLAVSSHHYTDKELKGACVAYFLTKRREYRNAMNPYKSLKEREEKKLRSRRYRLFAARSAIVRLFGQEDQRLWETATEELMSDEEDSPLEPGVWVARSPRFRSARLSDLCRRLDANSKHGLRPNRVAGPPSDRLPSSELGQFPPSPPGQLLGDVQTHPYVEVKVEKFD